MALKTLVKVGEITNLSDARYCAGMEVDYLGFPLDGDKEISFEEFTAITQWVEGVEIVGEFAYSDVQSIKEKIEKYDLSAIQVEDPSLVSEFEDCTVFLKIDDLENLNSLSIISPDYLIYDQNKNTLTAEELTALELQNASVKILIGTGINEANCMDLSKNLSGIHLKGSEEIRPGYKDFDELADILEALEVVDY